LVQQISGDLPDKFSGSSSDEEDAAEVVGWVGDSAFDPKDVDFELGDGDRDPPSFGFDVRRRILSTGSALTSCAGPVGLARPQGPGRHR
jgi:hypothetical protein